MILLVILLVAPVSSIDEIFVNKECRTCVVVNRTCYKVAHVLDLNAPFGSDKDISKMGVLRSKNTLFYSFQPRFDDFEDSKIGYVNLDSGSSGIVTSGTNIPYNFVTFAFKEEYSIVCLGGSNGISFFDTKSFQLFRFTNTGEAIDSLFYKNGLFYVKHGDLGVKVQYGNDFQALLNYVPVKDFVISKDDIFVFINDFGLFVGKGSSVYRISQNLFFRGLTVDLTGEVYTWWVDGIYKVIVKSILQESEIIQVSDLSFTGAMAFDNDNRFLFTMERSVFRLIETPYKCPY